MVTLQADGLLASLRLVPGVLVAPGVIAAIDSDGNGTFSANEQRAYAEGVLRDLSITVDGRSVQPTLRAWYVPRPRSCAMEWARSCWSTPRPCRPPVRGMRWSSPVIIFHPVWFT